MKCSGCGKIFKCSKYDSINSYLEMCLCEDCYIDMVLMSSETYPTEKLLAKVTSCINKCRTKDKLTVDDLKIKYTTLRM